MALIVTGTVVGGLILYNNQDEILINSLRLYTNIQSYFSPINIKNETNLNEIIIDNQKIKQYIKNNKTYYRVIKSHNDIEPTQEELNILFDKINPILSINIKINDELLDMYIISQFSSKKIYYNKNDNFYWYVLDTNFNETINEDILLRYDNELLIS